MLQVHHGPPTTTIPTTSQGPGPYMAPEAWGSIPTRCMPPMALTSPTPAWGTCRPEGPCGRALDAWAAFHASHPDVDESQDPRLPPAARYFMCSWWQRPPVGFPVNGQRRNGNFNGKWKYFPKNASRPEVWEGGTYLFRPRERGGATLAERNRWCHEGYIFPNQWVEHEQRLAEDLRADRLERAARDCALREDQAPRVPPPAGSGSNAVDYGHGSWNNPGSSAGQADNWRAWSQEQSWWSRQSGWQHREQWGQCMD